MLDVDKMPGRFENRVFIGGNYDHMAVLRKIENYVEENGFQPILAYDFDVPKDKIHDTDLRLLHNCKYAIFDETDPAGELMEIEVSKQYGTMVFIVYQTRDPESRETPPGVTTMVKTLGYSMYGYTTFEELRDIIGEWLVKEKKIITKDVASRIADTRRVEVSIKITSPPLVPLPVINSWRDPNIRIWLNDKRMEQGDAPGSWRYLVEGEIINAPIGSSLDIDIITNRPYPQARAVPVFSDGSWSSSIWLDENLNPAIIQLRLFSGEGNQITRYEARIE